MRTVDAGVGGGYTRGCVIEIPIPYPLRSESNRPRVSPSGDARTLVSKATGKTKPYDKLRRSVAQLTP